MAPVASNPPSPPPPPLRIDFAVLSVVAIDTILVVFLYVLGDDDLMKRSTTTLATCGSSSWSQTGSYSAPRPNALDRNGGYLVDAPKEKAGGHVHRLPISHDPSRSRSPAVASSPFDDTRGLDHDLDDVPVPCGSSHGCRPAVSLGVPSPVFGLSLPVAFFLLRCRSCCLPFHLSPAVVRYNTWMRKLPGLRPPLMALKKTGSRELAKTPT